MKKDRIRVAFFDTKPYDRKSFEEANADCGYELKFFEPHLTADTVGMARGYDVVCVFVNDVVDEGIVDALVEGGTRLLALRCAGYNNVNLYAAYKRLHVVRVPAYSPYAVAEHAVAMLLTLNRKTHRAYFRVRDNNFSINGLMGFDIHGKTVGVVGTGRIGAIFARIMKGFGTHILAFDHHPDPVLQAECGVEYVGLEELYRRSDIISLHCPLTPESKYMINAVALALMKPGVVLVNTSRGKLVDSAALIAGLKSGKVGGAALDVYEEEADYFFEDLSDSVVTDDHLARLTTFNNVLITSHQAFFTREAMANIAATTLRNIDDFANGRELENAICRHCDGSKPCPGKHGSEVPCPMKKING